MLIACVGFFSDLVNAQSEPTSNRKHLQQLTASDKVELRRQVEQFDQLSVEQKQQLRLFHKSLSSEADGDRLKQILESYHRWLKSLSPHQRASILELSPKERIDAIRRIKQQQVTKQPIRDAAHFLPPEDTNAMAEWFDHFVESRKDEIQPLLSDLQKRQLERANRREQRQIYLSVLVPGRKPNRSATALLPTSDDVRKLTNNLSDRTKQRLDNAPKRNDRQTMPLRWLRQTLGPRHIDDSFKSHLRRFYMNNLTSREREDLQRLPRENMQRELRRRYFQYRLREGQE